MELTPLEIRKKEFKKAMRGFDPEEVEHFLEDVSEYVEHMIAELSEKNEIINSLNEKIETMDTSPSESPKEPIAETKEEVPSIKDKEAELIIKEAELKALEILEKNRAEVHRIKEEIKTLKQQKNSFIKRLKHLFASQIELIEVLEIEDEELEDIKLLSKKIDKKRQNLKGVSKVPAFKRTSPDEKQIILEKREDEIENLDVTSLKSAEASISDDMANIKHQANKIVDQDNEKKDDESKDQLDLDNLLGDIRE